MRTGVVSVLLFFFATGFVSRVEATVADVFLGPLGRDTISLMPEATIHRVNKSKRRDPREVCSAFAANPDHDHRIPNLHDTMKATGMVVCRNDRVFNHFSANLISADVLVSTAHGIKGIERNGRCEIDPSLVCVFRYRYHIDSLGVSWFDEHRIDLARSELGGHNLCTDDVTPGDWAVLHLEEPVIDAMTYRLPAPGQAHDALGRALLNVAANQEDRKSQEECFAQYCTYTFVHTISSEIYIPRHDCMTARGASGGAVLKIDDDEIPTLIGVNRMGPNDLDRTSVFMALDGDFLRAARRAID